MLDRAISRAATHHSTPSAQNTNTVGGISKKATWG